MATPTFTTYKTSHRNGEMVDSDAQQERIERAISSACEHIELISGRQFDLGNITERISGQGTPSISLRNNPVYAVNYIRVYSTATNYVTLTSAMYRIDLESGRVELISSPLDWFNQSRSAKPTFPKGFQNIEVNYESEYQDWPAALENLVYEMVDWQLGGAGVREPAEGQTVMYRPDFTSFNKRIKLYRRVIV